MPKVGQESGGEFVRPCIYREMLVKTEINRFDKSRQCARRTAAETDHPLYATLLKVPLLKIL